MGSPRSLGFVEEDKKGRRCVRSGRWWREVQNMVVSFDKLSNEVT